VHVIDADTHVIENDDTFGLLSPDELLFRPLKTEARIAEGRPPQGHWLIDGAIRGRGLRRDTNFATAATRELSDIPARLRHMDELGVDVQVVYPTVFLVGGFQHSDAEVAVLRSYNRWIAERCAESGGRLRWVMLPPLQSINRAIEELRWAKEHGAVGILKKGDAEAGYWPSEPYFFPFYAEAERLDLPMCFHTGSGNPYPWNVERTAYWSFHQVFLPNPHALQSIITNKLPERFPGLRWGFLESTSSWIPFAMYHMHRLRAKSRERGHVQEAQNLYAEYSVSLADNHVFVACQTDEDLPYILGHAGEDCLLIGSDYSHQDSSEELRFVDALQHRVDAGDISQQAMRKIVDDNPRRFYGL
jgi:predicted TIM-barrel fold metal-dependent hydrolase